MDVVTMAGQERTEMADFLTLLRPEQWDHPSLCQGWRIRDVATHVISYDEHDWRDVVRRLAAARFRFGQLNEVGSPSTPAVIRRNWWSSSGNT